MGPIPSFNEQGLLPPGEYEVTFEELRSSILVDGPEELAASEWHADWRRHLTHQAEVLTRQLWQVGITDVFLDGSFVEDKPHPNDIDGYFVCEAHELASGELERRLNALDPQSTWTWDPSERRPYLGYAKRQLPMWYAYRVELYPHYQFGPPQGFATNAATRFSSLPPSAPTRHGSRKRYREGPSRRYVHLTPR